jgi:hypothetical protein
MTYVSANQKAVSLNLHRYITEAQMHTRLSLYGAVKSIHMATDSRYGCRD